MAKFQTLNFIPEGSLLNERLAERTVLKQTVQAQGTFGQRE